MHLIAPRDVPATPEQNNLMIVLRGHLCATLDAHRDTENQRDTLAGVLLVPIDAQHRYAPTHTKQVAVLASQVKRSLDPAYDETFMPFACEEFFDNIENLFESFADPHDTWAIAGLWHATGVRTDSPEVTITYGRGHVSHSTWSGTAHPTHEVERFSVDAGIEIDDEDFLFLPLAHQLVVAWRVLERRAVPRTV